MLGNPWHRYQVRSLSRPWPTALCTLLRAHDTLVALSGQRRTHVTHVPLALYSYTMCTTPGTRGPWAVAAPRACRRSAQIDARRKTGASVNIPWTYLEIFRGVHVPPVPPMGYAPARSARNRVPSDFLTQTPRQISIF